MDGLSRHMLYVAEICRVLGMNYGLGKTERQQLEQAASYMILGKSTLIQNCSL